MMAAASIAAAANMRAEPSRVRALTHSLWLSDGSFTAD